MDRVRLQEGIVQNRNEGKETHDRRIDRCRTCCLTIDPGTKNQVKAIAQISLLLGARKGTQLHRIEICPELLFPGAESGSWCIVRELLWFKLGRGRFWRSTRGSSSLKGSYGCGTCGVAVINTYSEHLSSTSLKSATSSLRSRAFAYLRDTRYSAMSESLSVCVLL